MNRGLKDPVNPVPINPVDRLASGRPSDKNRQPFVTKLLQAVLPALGKFVGHGLFFTGVMKMIRIMFLMYLVCWISFILGYGYIKFGSKTAKKLERFVWNSRIKKFQIQPFSKVIDIYKDKNFLLLFSLIIGVNINMVIFQALAGLILLAPITIIYQGFLAGSLIAQADRKTTFFALFVLIFELGAFSTAGALGLNVGIEWIFMKSTIIDGFKNLITTKYYLIPVICLVLNGLFESCGVVLGIEGVPGVKAVKDQLYK